MLGQWSIRHQGRKVFTFPHAVPEDVGKKFVRLIDNEFGTRKKNEDDFLRIEFWAQHQWDLHCIKEEEEYQEELRKHNLLSPLKDMGDVKFFFTDPKTGEKREIKPMKSIDAEDVYVDNEQWKDMNNEWDIVDRIMDRDMPHHLEEGEEDEEDDSN